MAPSGRFLALVVRSSARLLPREFRERVFEPAWSDLRLEEATALISPTRRLGRRVLLVVECLRIGVPQHLWYRGRPTRALGLALVVVLMVTAVLLMLQKGYD